MPMSVLHTNYFLFIVGVFTAYMLVSGRRYITIKSVNDVKKIDFMMAIIMFLFGLAFVVFGIFKLVCNNNFGIVLLVFGAISFVFVAQDYKNFISINLDRNTYLRSHISRMVGAYIASVTAFLVTNNYFLPSVIAWLLPSIVLVPLIIIWISKFAPKTK